MDRNTTVRAYQVFQVLFREPSVAITLLFKLVSRRLRHHGHFLRFELAFWLR